MTTSRRTLGLAQLFLVFLHVSAQGSTLPECENVVMVTRADWGARATRNSSTMETPVGNVVLHDTEEDNAGTHCTTRETCDVMVRSIQNYHMDDNGWDDIGYSFLIGEDGRVYEGRGWDRVGAHTLGWNDVSVAFAVIGDFKDRVPNDAALGAVRGMIRCGINNMKLASDYHLFAHRDVRPSQSPGNAFYELIKTWPHYYVKPTSKAVCQMPLSVSILMLFAAVNLLIQQ